jgi:hypothetical protein
LKGFPMLGTGSNETIMNFHTLGNGLVKTCARLSTRGRGIVGGKIRLRFLVAIDTNGIALVGCD